MPVDEGKINAIQDMIKNSKSKADVINVMKQIMELLPRSADVGVTIGEMGKIMYVLSYDGLYSLTAVSDEFLPFMISNEKKIPIENINESIANLFLKNKDNIIAQIKELLRGS